MHSIKKTSLFIALIAFTICCQNIQAKNKYDHLYQNLPFSMPRIEAPVFKNNVVSVSDFGGLGNGYTLNTEAFKKAVEALTKQGGGQLTVPAGVWYTGPIELKSNINLHLEKGALILFSSDFNLYPLVNTIFEGLQTRRCQSPISARNAENVAITGEGSINGSGEAWRPLKKAKVTEAFWKKVIKSGGVLKDPTYWFPTAGSLYGESISDSNVPRGKMTDSSWLAARDFLRPVMINFIECKNVLLQGVLFENSPSWNIHPLLCTNVIIDNITVRNPNFSQNGDGIDVESCKNVLIVNSSFDVGDDAICIKSGKDEEGRLRARPTENILVDNCKVFKGHGGFVVGSEMSGGVRNISVRNCQFLGTDVGLRFKSNRGRGGVVENIYISDVEMMNIPTQAISFNLYYSGRSASEDLEAGENGSVENLLPVTEETPQFKNIFIRDVNCKGAFQGIFLQGLPEMNLENIRLENIQMEADFGMICTDAKNVTVKNLTLKTKKTPVIDLRNSADIAIDGLVTDREALPLIRVSGSRTGNTVLKNAGITNKEKQLTIGKEVSKERIQVVK